MQQTDPQRSGANNNAVAFLCPDLLYHRHHVENSSELHQLALLSVVVSPWGAAAGSVPVPEYKMVQIPQEVTQACSARRRTGQEAAEYLEKLANQMAGDGWGFVRLDEMAVVTPPGCLGFGQATRAYVYVATFSRSSS